MLNFFLNENEFSPEKDSFRKVQTLMKYFARSNGEIINTFPFLELHYKCVKYKRIQLINQDSGGMMPRRASTYITRFDEHGMPVSDVRSLVYSANPNMMHTLDAQTMCVALIGLVKLMSSLGVHSTVLSNMDCIYGSELMTLFLEIYMKSGYNFVWNLKPEKTFSKNKGVDLIDWKKILHPNKLNPIPGKDYIGNFTVS